ncbi:hypothetical protein DL764_001946 [Monosporascus ibericus]|uniref:2EXR domain-containing protein n=1 Tax=Monosporascus ibericus TaxID=155417 RepID=A0A4Q4TQV8_9PEZI|nr:hypothetical protein DL764_001946 [Monosporascus ibericus]
MPNSTFWLEFSVFSDGLDAAAARRMSRHHASFAPFPSLPAELRLRVWEYMLAPRIVQVTCVESSSPSPSSRRERREGGAQGERREQEQVPVLLHVNRETRALALSHYELAFGWRVPHVLAMNVNNADGSGAPGAYYYPAYHYHHETLPTPAPTPASSSSAHTSSPPRAPMIKTGSEPRTYFSFARDALYLRGELEPHDTFGFNSPAAYFVSRADAARVRRVAVEFAALRYGEGAGPQQIFGSLFHVVDRFGAAGRGRGRGVGEGGGGWARAEEGGGVDGDGRGEGKAAAGGSGLAGNTILIAVTATDDVTHALLGGEGSLIRDEDAGGKRDDEEVWRRDYGGSGKQAGGGGDVTRKDGEGREDEPNIIQRIWRDWYRGSIVTSALAGVRFKLVREEDLERYL